MIRAYILLYLSIMESYCQIYSLEDRAIMLISNEQSITPIWAYFKLLFGLAKTIGISRMIQQKKKEVDPRPVQEVILRKKKIPFLHIELLAVKEEHWNQGYMSKMLEAAQEMAKQRGCLLIVETDELIKKEKYSHAGFDLIHTREVGQDRAIFDLCYDPSQDKEV